MRMHAVIGVVGASVSASDDVVVAGSAVFEERLTPISWTLHPTADERRLRRRRPQRAPTFTP